MVFYSSSFHPAHLRLSLPLLFSRQVLQRAFRGFGLRPKGCGRSTVDETTPPPASCGLFFFSSEFPLFFPAPPTSVDPEFPDRRTRFSEVVTPCWKCVVDSLPSVLPPPSSLSAVHYDEFSSRFSWNYPAPVFVEGLVQLLATSFTTWGYRRL